MSDESVTDDVGTSPVTVTWEHLAAEAAAYMRLEAEMRGPDFDEDGRPRHFSWFIEAGYDPDMLALAREYAERWGIPITARYIRFFRRYTVAYVRERGGLTYECEACGERFTPTNLTAKYCSNACRQRAYRARAVQP